METAMSEEVNKEPQEVSENLEVVISTGDQALSLEDFINKVEEIKKQNVHKSYEKLNVSMITKNNASVLMIQGVRKENQKELDERVMKDQVKKKSLEEQELKDYIRLKKKFDKKSA
jgi:hypothetical protein